MARPQTTVGGQDAYPTTWLKATALLQSIVNDHALVDGNQRLGWLATAVFLELNEAGVSHATDDDVYDLVITVASTPVAIEDIAGRLGTSPPVADPPRFKRRRPGGRGRLPPTSKPCGRGAGLGS